MHNEDSSRKRHGPPGKGMNAAEKPKDFKNAIVRLTKSLSNFKALIILALVLAALSSILSLVSPNLLSDLTDTISDGLVINTDNMKKLEEDLTTNVNEENIKDIIAGILNLKLDQDMVYKINVSDISSEDKILFNNTLNNITSDSENAFKYIGELPDSILDIIFEDSEYEGVLVIKEDKISFIKAIKDIDLNGKDYSFIGNLPSSINKILFKDSNIEGINITTEDKVAFITTMSQITEDTTTNEIYKLVDTLPDNIQKLINPVMDMNTIKRISIILAVLYIISAIFSYIEGFSMINVANKYAKKLRTSISEKINKLPLKFFDHNLSGDILSRVTNDVDTIAQSLNNSLSTLVSASTLFIGSIIMMFVTNWVMAITAILASLIGFVFMFLILGKSQKYFAERQVELGKLNGYIEEVYSGLNVVTLGLNLLNINANLMRSLIL